MEFLDLLPRTHFWSVLARWCLGFAVAGIAFFDLVAIFPDVLAILESMVTVCADNLVVHVVFFVGKGYEGLFVMWIDL